MRFVFILSLLFISSIAVGQIGMSKSQIMNMEEEFESRLVKDSGGKLIYNNNNVNFFYEFSGGTCAAMSVIGQKRFDFELKKQLYKRGYRLNDDYEYQRESHIASFIDLPNKYVQVVFAYTNKKAKKVDLNKSVDEYLGNEAVKKAFADSIGSADSVAQSVDFQEMRDSVAISGLDSATLADQFKVDSIKRVITDSLIRTILPSISVETLKSGAKMTKPTFTDKSDSTKLDSAEEVKVEYKKVDDKAFPMKAKGEQIPVEPKAKSETPKTESPKN
jgi:hypothetical protein